MISYDRGRGQTVDISANYSTLRLPQVTGPYDSGNYTCAPHNMSPDMVVVHILGGLHPAGSKGEAAEETAAAAVHDNEEKTEDIFFSRGGQTKMASYQEIVALLLYYLLLSK